MILFDNGTDDRGANHTDKTNRIGHRVSPKFNTKGISETISGGFNYGSEICKLFGTLFVLIG